MYVQLQFDRGVYSDEAFSFDRVLKNGVAAIKRMEQGSDEYREWQKYLLRYGLGEERDPVTGHIREPKYEDHEYAWSFCHNRWARKRYSMHCAICDTCHVRTNGHCVKRPKTPVRPAPPLLHSPDESLNDFRPTIKTERQPSDPAIADNEGELGKSSSAPRTSESVGEQRHLSLAIGPSHSFSLRRQYCMCPTRERCQDTCECRKIGMGCHSDCMCVPELIECTNPFNNLQVLFGEYQYPGYNESIPYNHNCANACFMKHLNSGHRIAGLSDSSRSRWDHTLQSLYSRLTLQNNDTDNAFGTDPALIGICREIALLGEHCELSDEYEDWQQHVLRYGLGVERDLMTGNTIETTFGFDDFEWSFCKNHWVRKSLSIHCETCNECHARTPDQHCIKLESPQAPAQRDLLDSPPPAHELRDSPHAASRMSIPPDAEMPDLGHRMNPGKKRAHSIASKMSEGEDELVTQTFPHRPHHIAATTCECTDGCATQTCPCHQWGASCIRGCQGDAHGFPSQCRNIFNRGNCGSLDTYFGNGLDPGHGSYRANACFSKAIEQAGKRASRANRTLGWEFLERLIRADEPGMERFEELREWQKHCKGLRKGSERRMEYVQQLFRLGLSQKPEEVSSQRRLLLQSGRLLEEDDHDREKALIELRNLSPDAVASMTPPPPRVAPIPFYSFCNSRWEDAHSVTHCPICDTCVDNARYWHCGTCNLCREGLRQPCEGCGGVSEAYGTEDDGREALEEQLEQSARTSAAWGVIVDQGRRRAVVRKRRMYAAMGRSRRELERGDYDGLEWEDDSGGL